MLRSIVIIMAATTAAASAVQADQPKVAPACASAPALLPDGLAGWARRSPVIGVAKLSETANARLTPDAGADATLLATPRERKNDKTGKVEKSVSYGGLFALTADRDGIYRVALGSKAWVDVLHEGETLDSIAHDHGPACSGIAKMVDFKLIPGDYIVMITASEAPVMPMVIGRLP